MTLHCDPQANPALHEILAAAENGDAALGATGIAIPLAASEGEHHVFHGLPLTGGASRVGVAYCAVERLFVHRTSLQSPSPPDVTARTYRLTPTELHVLLAAVEVGGAAEALGV
jgi:hypothetical protein